MQFIYKTQEKKLSSQVNTRIVYSVSRSHAKTKLKNILNKNSMMMIMQYNNVNTK